MKKIMAFLLVTVLLCSLVACAGETNQNADTTTTTTAETTQPAETTAAETTQPVETTAAETTQPVDTTAAETTLAAQVDYSVFCGNYSDTDTPDGPCYTVSIISVDNETKEIEIMVSYVGPNSSPIYTTESIYAFIASDHTVEFEWVDSWMNQGVGTLILNPDDPSTVQLMMTVTEEAEVNRASLSTNDEYLTFTRR